MSLLVDTGVIYAAHDTDATRHDAATAALDGVYDGNYGQPYVSDFVYDEVVTLTLERSNSWEVARDVGRKLRGAGSYPSAYNLLRISAAVFADAVDVFEQYDDQRLSFTDATTIAVLHRHDIDAVLSFDDDFDGLVDRIAPGAA